MTNELDIVIVNWNAGDQLRTCLASIGASALEGVALGRVVVVDNDSSDRSLEGINSFGLPVRLIKNTLNRGFGAACNQGAAESTSELLLFLNPDTVLNQDSLVRAVDFMSRQEHASIGVLGIKLFDERGIAAKTCARFPTLWMFVVKSLGLNSILPSLFSSYVMDDWDHESSREVDHVIGAFYLVRRGLFETLKGFDDRFFVYLEDLDFSLRVRQAGFKSYYLADVSAFHKGGGLSDQIRATRMFYSLSSRILYVNKHFSRLSATLIEVCTLVIEPLVRVVRAISQFSATQIVETLGAYRMLWSVAVKRDRK